MYSHNGRDEEHHSSVPCSPGASPKPGSPACHITRHANSSGGGSATSSTAGYAVRHSMTQVAAASAGAAASAADSPSGRSLTASRRASVTERPTQPTNHQTAHHRTASHGIVGDVTVLASPVEKPDKGRSFYSKVMSYGRRSSDAKSNNPSQQQQQLDPLSIPSQLQCSPEMPTASGAANASNLSGPVSLAAAAVPDYLSAIHQQQLGSTTSSSSSTEGGAAAKPDFAHASATAGAVAAAAALEGDLAAAAAAAAAEVAAALAATPVARQSSGSSVDPGSNNALLDTLEALTGISAGPLPHAAAAGGGRTCNAGRAGFGAVHGSANSSSSGSSSQLNSDAAARAVAAIFSAGSSQKDMAAVARLSGASPDESLNSSGVAIIPPPAPAALEDAGCNSSSSKTGIKPSTPSERARALARAALDALHPQLRKSRKAAARQEGKKSPKKEIKDATADGKELEEVAGLSAEASAAAVYAAGAAAGDDAQTAEMPGGSSGAALTATGNTPEGVQEAIDAAAAAIAGSLTASNSKQVAAALVQQPDHQAPEEASASAAVDSPEQGPRRQGTPSQSPDRIRSPEPSGVSAAAAFCVGGDVIDAERAVSLAQLGELSEYYRSPPAEALEPGSAMVIAGAGQTPATSAHANAAAAAAADGSSGCGTAGLSTDSTGITGNAGSTGSEVGDAASKGSTACSANPRSVTSTAGEAASVTSSMSGAAASVPSSSCSGDYRYSELIFRLQQFLPALKAADAFGSDFETTWEHVKSELTALVNTAKLAQLQTSRLESLDAEVVQLQTLLQRVGQDIRAGAQQQQLRDLFGTFPSFVRRHVTDGVEPSSPGTAATAIGAAAAAAAAAPAPVAAPRPLAQTIAHALASHSKYPHGEPGSNGRWSGGLETHGSTWSQGWSSSEGGDVTDASVPAGVTTITISAAGAGAAVPALAASAAGASPMVLASSSARGSLLSGSSQHCPASSHKGASSGSSRSSVGGLHGVAEGSPWRLTDGSSCSGSPKAHRAGPPPPKVLTAEEAEKLVSLYKVLDEKPRRIFYKELKLVHTKVSGGGQSRYSDAGNSPGASPRAHSATASPLATSTPPAAAAAWRRTVSIEAAEAMPAAAAAPELTAVSVAAERAEEYGEGQVEVQPACSGADPACDPLYCRSPVICSTGHAYIGSGVASSGVRSSWSVGVSKGFRAMRTIPEAHKKQPGDCQAGPGASQASGLREGSPSCRRQGSPASLRASLDSRLASQAYPYHQAGRTRVTDRSPDRLAAARQAHRRSSPVRGSLASAQQLQQPQEGVSGWSYPRGRELRLRASREGRLGHTTRSSIVSVSSTLPFSVPVVYPRARSTSPTLGMHYLERSGSGRRRTGGSLSPVRSSYTTSSAVSSTSSAPFKVNGVGGGAAGAGGPSPKGATGQAVVADYESFVLACKEFLDKHATAMAAEGLSPTKACGNDGMGGAKLVARLSPLKDADSNQIDVAMNRLAATLRAHGVYLGLSRLSPCLYTAAGRKLRVRMLNGNLLVRTGGGHQDLLGALGKLPLAAIDSGSSSRGSSSALSTERVAGSGNSSSAEEAADDSCYATLAAEAAAAAAAAAAEAEAEAAAAAVTGSGSANAQHSAAAAQHRMADEDAVAVIPLGEGLQRSRFEVQCAAQVGSPISDSALMAIVAEAVAGGGAEKVREFKGLQGSLDAAAEH